jgi:hypothetical protein
MALFTTWSNAGRRTTDHDDHTSTSVNGRGLAPSVSVKPYSFASAAATRTFPVWILELVRQCDPRVRIGVRDLLGGALLHAEAAVP